MKSGETTEFECIISNSPEDKQNTSEDEDFLVAFTHPSVRRLCGPFLAQGKNP
jgi:hypothetical protein